MSGEGYGPILGSGPPTTRDTAQPWPLQGRCGACGRPAQQFPSGRWEHHGQPCSARSGTVWAPTDVFYGLCRFVPDGEPLPGADPAGSLDAQIARVLAELAAEAGEAS